VPCNRTNCPSSADPRFLSISPFDCRRFRNSRAFAQVGSYTLEISCSTDLL